MFPFPTRIRIFWMYTKPNFDNYPDVMGEKMWLRVNWCERLLLYSSDIFLLDTLNFGVVNILLDFYCIVENPWFLLFLNITEISILKNHGLLGILLKSTVSYLLLLYLYSSKGLYYSPLAFHSYFSLLLFNLTFLGLLNLSTLTPNPLPFHFIFKLIHTFSKGLDSLFPPYLFIPLSYLFIPLSYLFIPLRSVSFLPMLSLFASKGLYDPHLHFILS